MNQVLYFISLFHILSYNYTAIYFYNYFKNTYDILEENKLSNKQLYLISSQFNLIYVSFYYYYFTNYYIYYIGFIICYINLIIHILSKNNFDNIIDKFINNCYYSIFRTVLLVHILNITYIYCICYVL